MSDPGDDFYIAVAMLHGAEIEFLYGHWYVNNADADDPVAVKNREEAGRYWFQGRAEAARAYCEYHKLI